MISRLAFDDIIDPALKLVGAVFVPVLGLLAQRAVLAYESIAKTRATTLHRQVLHAACDTAAGTVIVRLARGVLSIGQVRADSVPVLELARRTVKTNPAVVDALNLDAETIARIIVGKIGAMLPADPTVQTLLTGTKSDQGEDNG